MQNPSLGQQSFSARETSQFDQEGQAMTVNHVDPSDPEP